MKKEHERTEQFRRLFFFVVLVLLATGSLYARGRNEAASGTEEELPDPDDPRTLLVASVGFDSDSLTYAEAAGLEISSRLDGTEAFAYPVSINLADPPPFLADALSPSNESQAEGATAALSDRRLAMRISREWKIRFVVLSLAKIEDRRLIWRIGIFDGLEGTLLASDSSAGFAGITVIPQIKESAARVSVRIPSLASAGLGTSIIRYPLVFTGSQPGTTIYLGSQENGVALGQVGEDGFANLEYRPYEVGSILTLTAVLDGHHPREFSGEVPRDPPAEPFEVPTLLPELRGGWYLGLTVPRVLGVTGGLRWYPAPDFFFLFAQDNFWLSYPFLAGSLPVLHNEVRAGFGLYPFTPPDFPFRISIGASFSAIMTYVPVSTASFVDPFQIDLTFDPIVVGLEAHLQPVVLFGEIRGSYALGTGFLQQGWLDTDTFPFILTLGGMWRW